MGSAELPSGFEPNNTYTPATDGLKERLAAYADTLEALRLGVAMDVATKLQNVTPALSAAAMREALARITQLEAEVERLKPLLQDCADELESEIRHRWLDPDGNCHPALQHKFDRDMASVVAARAALTGENKPR